MLQVVRHSFDKLLIANLIFNCFILQEVEDVILIFFHECLVEDIISNYYI
jgi:hypothetical protein